MKVQFHLAWQSPRPEWNRALVSVCENGQETSELVLDRKADVKNKSQPQFDVYFMSFPVFKIKVPHVAVVNASR